MPFKSISGATERAILAALTPATFGAGEAHVGQFGGETPRVTGQLIRAADATGAYGLGDGIMQSTTGSTNTPIDFDCARINGGSGLLVGCRAVLKAASGTIVISNCAFDLLLFRPDTDIPFAAGSYPADNAALTVSADAMKQLAAVFSFSASGWRNQAGANAAAGDHVSQAVPLGGIGELRTFAPFNLAALGATKKLRGVLQAQAAWNPGNVQQTFDFALDIQQD